MLLDIDIDSFELKHKFTISRGSKNSAEVITVSIKDSGFIGLGECVPYKRYGESIESVSKEILSVPLPVNNEKLQTILKHGAARNAIDCALWDLQAKKEGKPVWKLLNLTEPKPAVTAYTISLATPEKMMQEAKKKNNFPILKVKLGSKYDEQCIKAVREGSPNARIIVDANEGWTIETYNYLVPIFKKIGVKVIRAGDDIKIHVVPDIELKSKYVIKNFSKDHRVLMMSCIAALTFGGEWKIHDYYSVKTSFPKFLKILKKIKA